MCLVARNGTTIFPDRDFLSADPASAVFSYWTTTLDVIEQALEQATIVFTRYDGRMQKAKRDLVLSNFANDPAVQVLLVSITCGGQGYDPIDPFIGETTHQTLPGSISLPQIMRSWSNRSGTQGSKSRQCHASIAWDRHGPCGSCVSS